jgi:hypothetical protein
MADLFQFPAASPLSHARSVIRAEHSTDDEVGAAVEYLSLHGDTFDRQAAENLAHFKPAPISTEYRQAVDFVRETSPQDLVWAFPGETRLLTEAEFEVAMPQQFRCVPIRRADRLPKLASPEPDVGTIYPAATPLAIVAASMTFSLAVYGAARLIPDLVAAHPWLIGWLDHLMSLF